MKRRYLPGSRAAATALLLAALAAPGTALAIQFLLTLSNVATEETLGGIPLPLAPGVWAVHTRPHPFFQAGRRARRNGLEALAEDGEPQALLRAASKVRSVLQTGTFPKEALLPGQSQTLIFSARAGERLSFATMLVQSNDKFYAPASTGIALFNAEGEPISRELTSQIYLWDAGTEADEAPGKGPHQAPRQEASNTGKRQKNGRVRIIRGKDAAGFAYPSAASLLKVEISVYKGELPR